MAQDDTVKPLTHWSTEMRDALVFVDAAVKAMSAEGLRHLSAQAQTGKLTVSMQARR